ncbi:ABC transporter substrate-binding protein [Flexivirga meconopsidis]|uniref:ABC transporter substrate-binding protein n=1 Tax=Flexivirga meconopsidis TaxID=2977121 RepID=UPI00223F591E|nr:ABC transporter substrate-binding protein [Flexivirga meconopsidis]
MFTDKFRIMTAGTVLATAIGVGAAATTPALAAPGNSGKAVAHGARQAATSLPVTGTLPDGTVFSGSLSNLRTYVQNGALMVKGTIRGTGLPAAGTTFTAPVEQINGQAANAGAAQAAQAAAAKSCSVLNLVLGPLHLDLLGLVIDLNKVVLDITAVPGAGNLLGNLVCAIAGLLDKGGPLAGLSALLNNLLSALGLALPVA